MSDPRAAVVVFPGSNGDRDLLEALTAAGFDAVLHPSGTPVPADVDLVGLPGGFSFGDYWRAGMLASHEPSVRNRLFSESWSMIASRLMRRSRGPRLARRTRSPLPRPRTRGRARSGP